MLGFTVNLEIFLTDLRIFYNFVAMDVFALFTSPLEKICNMIPPFLSPLKIRQNSLYWSFVRFWPSTDPGPGLYSQGP